MVRPDPSERDRDLAALRQELRRLGCYERPTTWLLTEMALRLALTLAGIVVVVLAHDLLLQACGMAIMTLGAIAVAMCAHTSAHYAMSGRRWLNELVTYFGMAFFMQVPTTFWRHKHNVLHHTAPNVVGIDNDADFRPLFAFSEQAIDEATGWQRTYFRRLQGWAFLPSPVIVNGVLVVSGWIYLLAALRDSTRRTRAHLYDLLAVAAHWLAWVVLPLFFFSWQGVLAFTVARYALQGVWTFVFFSPAHFPAEAQMLDTPLYQADPLYLQTATTVNFRPGWLGRLFSTALEYQIEHHLFPGISHTHYRKVSPLVEAFCRKHGLPYRVLGWGEALLKVERNMFRPKPVMTLADVPESVRSRRHGPGPLVLRDLAWVPIPLDKPAGPPQAAAQA